MTVLVTGGAGFIGSHACLVLLQAGMQVVVVDNLSNSSRESLRRVETIAQNKLDFIELDICNRQALAKVFEQHPITAVMHFAGLKAVGESIRKPLHYYRNNVEGSLNLFQCMQETGVRDLIFSSSATVYGDPLMVPIKEEARVAPTNPYGQTKLMIETILQDLSHSVGSKDSDKPWRIALLRYFNPVGAHVSGLIGEDPHDIPNNLLPYIAKVSVGVLKELSVFGQDYPTVDGTGVRDYIHVMDLVGGHLSALRWLQKQNKSCCEVFNLGTGKGYSVLEVVDAFEQASGKKIPYKIAERRAGDIASCYADAKKAERVLGWQTKHTLTEMMSDAWRWQKNNPNGYR